MPRTAEDVVADLKAHLTRRSGKPFTMDWDSFYTLCKREKCGSAAQASLQEAADEVNMLLAFGSEAVAILEDAHFAPSHPCPEA